MKIKRKIDRSCHRHGQIEVPDDLELCAICGEDIWPGEPVAWNEDNHICHADCVEEENNGDKY